MYKCKQHIHELFWVASRFLKKIICNELYLCTRNKDGIRRILNCKCTGDFWLLCVAQSISSFISVLILNMQSWLCLLCSSYFSLQQSGLESATRARCRAGSAPPRASPRGPAAASPALLGSAGRWIRALPQIQLSSCALLRAWLRSRCPGCIASPTCCWAAAVQRTWLRSPASSRQVRAAGGWSHGRCRGYLDVREELFCSR